MKSQVSLVFFLTVENLDDGDGWVSPEKGIPLRLQDDQTRRLLDIVKEVLSAEDFDGNDNV